MSKVVSRSILGLLALGGGALWLSVGTVAAPTDAEAFKKKMTAITEFRGRPGDQPRRTTVSETEVNAYLASDSHEQLPAGVVEPQVGILGTGRITGRAVVDLDQLRKDKKVTSPFDPASYLTGRLPVSVTGVLKTNKGQGQFDVESATVGGLPVPKRVLQEIVSYYSRSADSPTGVSLDSQFALPAKIQE